jgi:ubiquinone/menaquinone biosynthesis C-methylase UbiE
MNSSLDWTGERLVTDVEGVFGVAEHLHRYAIAQQLAKGKKVIDLASGEGYGTNLLSDVAEHVTGIDISVEAVEHANKKYASSKSNLEYKSGSASNIPMPDSSVDMVSSFETLEHTTEQNEFFEEIKRVLKPGGFLIMSTPDTTLYKIREPENPYHVKELTTEEFVSLAEKYFKTYMLLKQHYVTGSFIMGLEKQPHIFSPLSGNYTKIEPTFGDDTFYGKAFFNLIIATDLEELPDVTTLSLFNYVPQLLKEFKGSRGLMFELLEAQKKAKRLEEIENSRTYKLASMFSRVLSRFKIFK